MKRYFYLCLLILMVAGCTPTASASGPMFIPTRTAEAARTPTARPDDGNGGTGSSPTQAGPVDMSVALAEALPDGLRQAIHLPEGVHFAGTGESAAVKLEALSDSESSPAEATWVYAVVAPFATIADGISLDELKSAWKGWSSPKFADAPILVSPETKAAFDALWGNASDKSVKVLPAKDLLAAAWAKLPSFAIVPFEELGPRWKVLRIGNQSPLDKNFKSENYPLSVRYGLAGDGQAVQELVSKLGAESLMPVTNRDPDRLSVVVMTGTTALVRKTAETMDKKGVLYPEKDIRDWLVGADILHISNELSFYEKCPPPAKRNPNFCSNLKYMELFKDIGTDVVELTGNHVLDWGSEPFLNTLKMYADAGMAVYGGGKNQADARQPVFLNDHGNRFAFIGCNASGPASDWAGEKTAGSARCDFDWMKAEVAKLKAQGYLVITTFQHVEVCSFEAHLGQKADFGKMVEAGADIVSGSQAHCPQSMLLKDGQFVHYGLGNLFFDQMDDFAKQEFIDRHVFYDGKYISTELLTAVLEDYAKPRPMTEKERAILLENAFRASGWIR